MDLPSHGRYDYVPITRRPDFTWPGGKRLAVYIAVNLEHFAFGEGLGAALAPGGPQPDVLNYAWRDYGNRVGAWRLLEMLEELALPSCAIANSAMFDYAPELPAAFAARGDEIVAHGRSNSERQGDLDPAAEAKLIAESTEILTHHSGKPPRGWLGPWISQSRVTPDLLQEAGYAYLLDWCHDDQPTWFRTRRGRILSVPYPQELNDIPAIVARQMDAPAFADMIVDQFREMLHQSRGQPLVMGIALHPYIVGQPYRLYHLRRALTEIEAERERLWLTTPGAIAEAFAALPQ
ncbi:MAG TPA: polysaccharide deacetylase family protein [Alphaproteobacteria bacterium]|nr:polysaccharide deacetylase family protein [Alphaproteobacteria bacterium]